jgi:HEXXH motif-containing protein
MAAELRYHRLTESDLAAVAAGRYTNDIIARLEAAEYSKNVLLLEMLRREVQQAGSSIASRVLQLTIKALSDVQVHSPDVVSRLLTMPHFGYWAAYSLARMRAGSHPGQPMSSPVQAELGYVAGFAAVSALLTGHHLDVLLPVRNGTVFLPTLGEIRLRSVLEPAWARLRLNHASTELVLGSSIIKVPIDSQAPVSNQKLTWVPTPRLQTIYKGLALSVLFEGSDPFLARLGPTPSQRQQQSIEIWQECLDAAWRLLTRRHQTIARALARGLTTLIPLNELKPNNPISAASGWAWGAVALSAPSDPTSLAETLIHEFHHLLLGAIEDIEPLIFGNDEEVYYSPWRGDPRPLPGILQGSYAFEAVTAFWRTEYRNGGVKVRRRAEIAFSLGRRNVLDALITLSDSSTLTSAGRFFVTAMRDRLDSWLTEPVSERAEAAASEIDAEHRLRWRFNNIQPKQATVDSLTEAWLAELAGSPSPVKPPTFAPPKTLPHTSTYDPIMTTRNLSRQADLTSPRIGVFEAREYGQRAIQVGDIDAWVKLILTLRRLGTLQSGWSVMQPIELVVAVADKVRSATGDIANLDRFIARIVEMANDL